LHQALRNLRSGTIGIDPVGSGNARFGSASITLLDRLTAFSNLSEIKNGHSYFKFGH
jgi:hypothetical protein